MVSTESLTRPSSVISRLGEPRALIVWALLAGATFASYVLGAENGIDSDTVAALLVIGVAVIKVRLVAIHFMELDRAPLVLRGIVEAYCVGVFVMLSALYLVGVK